MRYKLMRLLMNKQRMKAVDEVGFHRDVRKAVEKNMRGRSDVTTDELIKALECLKDIRLAFCCLDCKYEHNCGVHGCAIIKEAIKTTKLYQAAYKVLEKQRDCETCLYNNPCGMDDLRCTVCTRGQKWRWDRGGNALDADTRLSGREE